MTPSSGGQGFAAALGQGWTHGRAAWVVCELQPRHLPTPQKVAELFQLLLATISKISGPARYNVAQYSA